MTRCEVEAVPAGTNPVEAARIVMTSGARVVDGVILDHFTASAMVQVHDALSPTNQARFAALPLTKAVDVTWAVARKASTS